MMPDRDPLKIFLWLTLLPMLGMLLLTIIILSDIQPLQQPINKADNSPVRALDTASHLQFKFAQMDIALTRYDADADLSIEARMAMDEYYQFFDDYFELMVEHSISAQGAEILQEMQIELAQWLRVRDKIFEGTADAVSIALISERIQALLAQLVAVEMDSAYQQMADIAQTVKPAYIWGIFLGIIWLVIMWGALLLPRRQRRQRR